MNIDIPIEEFKPLIKSIANNFYGVEYNDLYQAGVLGLIQAYNHYKDDGKTKFSTYAYKYIFGEMYNYMLSAKALKQNRDILKLTKLIEKTNVYLTQSLGKVPTTLEIANYLNIDPSLVSNAINSTYSILSLDNELDNDTSLYNTIKDEKANNIDYLDLKWGVDNLEEPYRSIIKLRYFDDYTQQEVARKLNLTQVKVSRYERKSLDELYQSLH